jgi:hypothetical protein
MSQISIKLLCCCGSIVLGAIAAMEALKGTWKYLSSSMAARCGLRPLLAESVLAVLAINRGFAYKLSCKCLGWGRV